jgi:hypothetical protein
MFVILPFVIIFLDKKQYGALNRSMISLCDL